MLNYAHPQSLVSTQWLADHLDDPAVRIVEVVWGAKGPSGMDVYDRSWAKWGNLEDVPIESLS